jgi:hypothetical protein
MKWSNFHVTVNFNRRNPALVPLIKDAVDRMADEDVLWTWLKHFNGQSQVTFPEDCKFLVDRVRMRAGLESGGAQNGGNHVHILVEIAHETKVQLNKRAIERHMKNVVGLEPNVLIQFLDSDKDRDRILYYITKETPSRRRADAANDRLRRAMHEQVVAVVDEHV